MDRYRAYGLSLHSALPLPELVPADAPADAAVRFGRIDLPLPVARSGLRVESTPQGVHFYWEDTGSVLVRSGSEILLDPIPDADERELRLAILGPALSALLHQRGLLPLHASVVANEAGAVAFLGPCGAGKSTLAAALLRHGYQLLADDVAAVEVSETAPTVFPAFPQLKLWPQAARLLGDAPAALPRLSAVHDKRARRLAAGFAPSPVPLQRIYSLAWGERDGVAPLQGQEAVMELVCHSQAVQLHLLASAEESAAHFQQCAALAGRVELHRLTRRQEAEPAEMARLVERAA